MTIGLVNSLGAMPAGGGSQSAPKDGIAGMSGSGQAVITGGVTTAAVEGSGRTQTAQAVQPTPATSTAVKVDMLAEEPVDADVNRYPISGPDKFAKSIAQQNQATFREEAEADVTAETEQTAKVETERAEAAPVEDDAPVAADTQEAPETEAATREVPEVRTSANVPMGAAERGEARLTA